MPPLVQKIEPGDVIGRCRTVRELGRGGVGTVYLATHQTLQIEVALKVLSPALSMENPALAERFIREAQLAARIRHPNVIAVMDAAHDELTGLYYIVMEYVGGGSLSWHLRNGPMQEAKALAIITGIAHALVIAEENRIVHRDIKPDNIMLDLRGTSKLADLGLAKHSLDSHVSLTLGGSFMGTPAYMSPEQARDAKIADTRDDIYSLGASFYECLTGLPPFQGETPYNIMSELLTKPSPRPCALRPGLSRSADLICRKMMAKTRDLRYANARELLQDLQHAQACGDSGLDQLQAASFDEEWKAARQQEANFGIETSADGVYTGSGTEDETPASNRARPNITLTRRGNNDVFGAAALLIALVLVTTLFVAWAGPNHALSFLQDEFAQLTGKVIPPPAPLPGPKPAKAMEQPHIVKEKPPVPVKEIPPEPQPVVTETSPAIVTPAPPTNAMVTPAPTNVVQEPPVVFPESSSSTTNVPADNMVMPPADVSASSATLDSAFAARDIAEKNLDPDIVSPTGRAELLKIVGKRDSDQATPTSWTFYFFDKKAAGHALIVTVNGGKVTKTGEDVIDFASPYEETAILPEDKVQKDSSDALQIAHALVPDSVISSSEFTLTQPKNSVPIWKVTLWTKTDEGEERKLADVTILAETGTVFSKHLNQSAMQPQADR